MRVFFTLVAVILGLLTVPVYAQSGRDAAIRDAAIDAQVFAPVVDASASDGKAAVFQLEGKAMITPKGSPEERDLKVGDEIGIGDAVYTEKGASLSISFDNRKQNAVRIPAETKATFTSIEPTDIKLDDGTIFSIVNGLAKGSTWKVTTPSAVAAVRGTVFETTYRADTKEFFAATLEVADDGKTSAIEIESLVGEGLAEVVEGKEISFKAGEVPSQERVQEFTPDKAAEVQQFHQEVSSERQKSDDSSNNHGGGNGPGGPGGGSGTAGGGSSTGGTSAQTGGHYAPHAAGYNSANTAAEALARAVAGGNNSAKFADNNFRANMAAEALARNVAGGNNLTRVAENNFQANMAAEELARAVAKGNDGSVNNTWTSAEAGGVWNDAGSAGGISGGLNDGGAGAYNTGGGTYMPPAYDPTLINNWGCDAACQTSNDQAMARAACIAAGGTNC